MQGAAGERRWRPRLAGLISGVAIGALCLAPSIVDAVAAAGGDDLAITDLRQGCRLLADTSVQRWLPGSRAQREEAEPDGVSCRWRAADPTRNNPTVRLEATAVEGTDETPADQVARQALYARSGGPSLALAGLRGNSDGSVQRVRVPEIGDEAVTTVDLRPREQDGEQDEVTATVHVRRANAVVRVSFHAYGVPEATAVEAAQTLAREAVNRL